jgi:hypothetical protein
MNEESGGWDPPGEKIYTEDAPYCGARKFHFPTEISVSAEALVGAPDLFFSEEWFGSGGSAFRAVICNERFVKLVRSNKLRGIGFDAVRTSGYSIRNEP